jgi:hypothetical protein
MINADDDNTGAMKTTMTADCAPTTAVLYDDASYITVTAGEGDSCATITAVQR